MDALHEAALIAVRDCMGVKPGEKALVITDGPTRKIGYALFEVAKKLGAEAFFIEIITRSSNGQEPPAPVAELMKLVDVILIPTLMSMSHTDSRREASKNGVRIATLPGITEDLMVRTLEADYFEIGKLSDAVAKLLTEGSEVRVTSANGTDVTMGITGRDGTADTGLNHTAGSFSNLPAGEAYLAPMEGRSEGVVVIDGSMAGVGLLGEERIRIEITGGYATAITGGEAAEKLLSLMEPHGAPAFNVAELGIGTNDRARITGNVLEDEKAIGTAHIAFGDNKSMGGTVRVASHLDGVILSPSVLIDGKPVLEDGELVL